MNGIELTALHKELTELSRSLMSRKNHDYTGKDAGANDALANFRVATEMGLCNLPQSVLIRLTDKVKRLATSTNRQLLVKDEGVRDTVLDLINYAVLFYAAHLETQGAPLPEAPGQAPSEPAPPQFELPPSPIVEGSLEDTEACRLFLLKNLASAPDGRLPASELQGRFYEWRAALSRRGFLVVTDARAQPPTSLHADTGQLVPYTGLASDSCQDER